MKLVCWVVELASHNPPASTFQVEGIRAVQHYTWLPKPHNFPFHQDVPLLLSIKLTTWRKVPFVRHHPPKRWHSNSCTMKTCVVIVTDIPFSNHNSQPRQPATWLSCFLFHLTTCTWDARTRQKHHFKVSSKAIMVFVLAGSTNENKRCFSLGWQIYKSKGALSLFTMQNPPRISYTLHFTTNA